MSEKLRIKEIWKKHHLDHWFVFGNYLTKKQESLILCLDFYYIKGLK